MNDELERKIRFRTSVARAHSQAVSGFSGTLMVKESPSYDGRAGELFKIVLANLMLTLVTAGIYRFWAKTRVRRYFLSRASFLGDRLEYTGTGKELFLGFLIVLAILMPVYIVYQFASNAAFTAGPEAYAAVQIGYFLLFYFLFFVATYRARRYRLSRTMWRGIRGGQTGSAMLYAVHGMFWSTITVLTLGLAYPVMRLKLQAYKTDRMTFGNRTFSFDGGIGPLFGAWLLPWLGLVIATTPFALLMMDIDFDALTIGNSANLPNMTGTRGAYSILMIAGIAIFLLTQFWYRAAEVRHFAASTEFDELRFDSSLSGFNVFWPYFFYGFLLVLLWVGALTATLGLLDVAVWSNGGQTSETVQTLASFAGGFAVLVVFVIGGTLKPIIVHNRLFRKFCETLTLQGSFSPDRLLQSQLNIPQRGEGLADALDVDAF
jgi:uncharacterized membrane protein YjgN (DUF898 family)